MQESIKNFFAKVEDSIQEDIENANNKYYHKHLKIEKYKIKESKNEVLNLLKDNEELLTEDFSEYLQLHLENLMAIRENRRFLKENLYYQMKLDWYSYSLDKIFNIFKVEER